jgi:outer membrane protein OmpA-like peptidoglycan-associated protein
MKKNLNALIIVCLLFIPAFNFSQTSANNELASNYKLCFTKGEKRHHVINEISVASLSPDQSLTAVFFSFNDFILKKVSIYELERYVRLLNEFPSSRIEISGHTDDIGSNKYNEALAKKRTDAIIIYFKDQANIAADRILVKNYGETQPLAGNETELGRELNRRVEIKLLSK